LQPGFALRSRTALQVDPERSPLDHLKVHVAPAHLGVVEEHVNPLVATDHRKRLWQEPELGCLHLWILNDEPE
jgi:hypothetical protein